MTTTTMDPRTVLAGLFGGEVSVAPAPTVAITAGPNLAAAPKAAECVKRQCHPSSLGIAYQNAVDGEGRPAPGRMIQQFEKLSLMADGVAGWKTNQRKIVDEVVGVIVRIAPAHRALWYRGEGQRYPVCGSLDGVRGHGRPGGDCEICPRKDYDPDEQFCRSRTRLYIATGQGMLLSHMDLTALTREGLTALDKWCAGNGFTIPQLVVKLGLAVHPRSSPSWEFAASIITCQPVYLADDGTDDYADAIQYANDVLRAAEAAWLADIARPQVQAAPAPVVADRARPALPTTGRVAKAVAAAPVTVSDDVFCPETGELCPAPKDDCLDGCKQARLLAAEAAARASGNIDVDDLPF